ncbi:MAG: hypothetical protein LBU56_00850 [Rickettsiales bacterium]|jgi:hypothetical protein|nr:hypothetical protein [Rickettsiales bacterium]
MKKSLIVTTLLILVGCISFASGGKEYEPHRNSIEDFQGTWRQVDGSTVITISGTEFELVDMELGWAGWGRIDLGYLNYKSIIRIDMDHDFRGAEKSAYLLNLNTTASDFDFIGKNRSTRHYITRDFMIKAWEDFKVPVAERNNRFYNDLGFPNEQRHTTGGGGYWNYEFNGNNLKLTSTVNERTLSTSIGFALQDALFSGEYVKVR